jgi:hypothetical protein
MIVSRITSRKASGRSVVFTLSPVSCVRFGDTGTNANFAM